MRLTQARMRAGMAARPGRPSGMTRQPRNPLPRVSPHRPARAHPGQDMLQLVLIAALVVVLFPAVRRRIAAIAGTVGWILLTAGIAFLAVVMLAQ